MQSVDPKEYFRGIVVLTVPHMDDCVLACGGTIAKLSDTERFHVIYATDGMASPAPVLPWRDSISQDLNKIRMEEARFAMAELGIPQENVHFLNLPDSRLQQYKKRLQQHLNDHLAKIKPDFILTPFRYDRHPDHLALNHSLTAMHKRGLIHSKLIEYFIYYQLQLLPERDLRKYIHPEHLFAVDILDVSDHKMHVLGKFKSQTTCFFPWQTRPNLTPQLLDTVCREPEIFVKYDPSVQGADIFKKGARIIPIAHRIEPIIKKKKDQAVAIWKRARRNYVVG